MNQKVFLVHQEVLLMHRKMLFLRIRRGFMQEDSLPSTIIRIGQYDKFLAKLALEFLDSLLSIFSIQAIKNMIEVP